MRPQTVLCILCMLGSVWLVYTDDYGTGYDDGAADMCSQLTDDNGAVDVGTCVVTTASGARVVPVFELREVKP